MQRSELKLVPINQIEYDIEKQKWRSLGEDPFFFIDGDYPKGWIELNVISSSAMIVPLKVYWDDGSGISEENSTKIGSLPIGNRVSSQFTFYIPKQTRTLRLDTGTQKCEFELSLIDIKIVGALTILKKKYSNYINLSKCLNRDLILKAAKLYKKEGIKGVANRLKSFVDPSQLSTQQLYQEWIRLNGISEYEINQNLNSITRKFTISVIMPVYNTPEEYLKKAIDSVREQLYPHWELCICNDASSNNKIQAIIEQYAQQDSRIKFIQHEKQQNISVASNSALSLASGEYVAFLDHDDEFTKDALYEVALLLNNEPDTDMIYSDEDKIDVKGNRSQPFFKPDWSPNTLLSQMYTCHLTVYRLEIVKKIGGFRVGYEGSQDYDLALRIVELTKNIRHINKILYHWRMSNTSTATSANAKTYTSDAGVRALKDTINRRGYNAKVFKDELANVYVMKHLPKNEPLISILIPTRNMAEVLSTCVDSIFKLSTYSNFEVIIIDNGSDDPATLDLFNKYIVQHGKRFKVLRLDIPFNYSKLNNLAAREAQGELILLLNNDVEIITPDWLEGLAGQAQRNEIGAVGAKLLYPDSTIQHAGVMLGISGTAGHSHKHFPENHPGYFSRLRMVSDYAAVTGACLMVKRKLFLEVDGLDEDLQVAFNDVDFCLKLIEKGYYNVYVPHVVLYHYESKSRGYENTPEKMERFNKEADYLKKRWAFLLDNDPFYSKHLSREREDFSLML
ncbi:glycosyltransferase family 2 protein [Paenibacillus sp. WLX2291]|uniref:glycosyltransferase family 2 protein n=1 Tax=Paenibacillus sp. WLX2291 TaxID=3296934 RepID=UPI003983EEAE